MKQKFDLLPQSWKRETSSLLQLPSAPKIGGLSDLDGRLESQETAEMAALSLVGKVKNNGWQQTFKSKTYHIYPHQIVFPES